MFTRDNVPLEEYATGRKIYAISIAASGIAPECPTPCRNTHVGKKTAQEESRLEEQSQSRMLQRGTMK
jgi:hypothetical protein